MSDDQKQQRTALRQRLALDLSKHLLTGADRTPLRGIAIDISRIGIGLVTFTELEADSDVILVLKERGITLKVKWCKPDSVRQGVFHVGLGTKDVSINLWDVLEKEGLVTAESVVSNPQQKEQAVSASFADFRVLLTTARTHDNKLLRQGRLASLAETYNAYPVNHQGKSIFILIPKGLKPLEASSFDDSEALTKKIFVASIENGNPRIIWPSKASL